MINPGAMLAIENVAVNMLAVAKDKAGIRAADEETPHTLAEWIAPHGSCISFPEEFEPQPHRFIVPYRIVLSIHLASFSQGQLCNLLPPHHLSEDK
jgi:hypothetical protein